MTREKSLKIKHILEARYAAPPDTQCKRCGKKFNFDDVLQRETSFFRDFAMCPGCQMKILRDTRKKLHEAKYYSSDTIRLSGTLVAGTNDQHHEPVQLVIGECGEADDWGLGPAKSCTLLDFEGGVITAHYLKAPARIDFIAESTIDYYGWSVRPLDDHDWMVYEKPPKHKKLREAKYAGDPRGSQWFKDLQHIIRHNIHEYGDTDHDQEGMYRWANDYKQILEKLYREVLQSRDDFIEDWHETWFEDHDENVSEEVQKKRREHAADLWLSTEEHFNTSTIYRELRRRHSTSWVDFVMNLMVDVAGGMRE